MIGFPTLVDSSAPCLSDPAPLSDGPRGGAAGPREERTGRGRTRRRGDRRAPSTWEAIRLREANWYPTRNVGASEAIQISANRAECVCQWVDHIRDEKLPASGLRERDIADVDRDRQPFGCGAPIENATANGQPQGLRARVPPADETVQPDEPQGRTHETIFRNSMP
jgi:hypothetical protein